MKTVIEVQNVMACGCNNSIHKGLGQLCGVFGVRVEPEKSCIVIEHADEVEVPHGTERRSGRRR